MICSPERKAEIVKQVKAMGDAAMAARARTANTVAAPRMATPAPAQRDPAAVGVTVTNADQVAQTARELAAWMASRKTGRPAPTRPTARATPAAAAGAGAGADPVERSIAATWQAYAGIPAVQHAEDRNARYWRNRCGGAA